MVVDHRKSVNDMARAFYKMSGSGNDFVFFETTDGAGEGMSSPEAVRTLCARGTGVGADGVVFLQRKTSSLVAISYYNSDGSLGELCGNATLCAARLAHDLDLVTPGDMGIDTDSGTVTARMTDGLPEIDLAPVFEVAVEAATIQRLPGELSMGFARVGVPHIVVVVEDIEAIDVLGRGSQIRRDRSLRDGANVNFLAAAADGSWRARTYERGVEGETLACGTGAVAAAILLVEWGRAKSPVLLETRSGKILKVSIRREGERWYPSLRGNADLVFIGHLGPIFGALQFRPTPSESGDIE